MFHRIWPGELYYRALLSFNKSTAPSKRPASPWPPLPPGIASTSSLALAPKLALEISPAPENDAEVTDDMRRQHANNLLLYGNREIIQGSPRNSFPEPTEF